MVSPLPMMVRLSPATLFPPPEMTGSPVGPSVVLSTAVKTYGDVVGAVRAIVFVPPATLAALMSAIRSETVAARKLDGRVRSSSCSNLGRMLRRGDAGAFVWRLLRNCPDHL